MSIDPQFCADMAAAEIAVTSPTKRDKAKSAAWKALRQRLIDAATPPVVDPPVVVPPPVVTPPPPVVTPPVDADVPAGYKLHKRHDLSRDEGWTLETGKPSNADGSDRPANVRFGQGPDSKSMLIVFDRDTTGKPYTGDAKGMHAPIPNWHRTRAVIEYDPMTTGVWPAVWKRPMSGDGEIDDWEKFGGHGSFAANTAARSWPVDAGTLHTTPYDATHKQLQRGFPELGPGRHVIETELAATGFTWWVDGVKVGSITPAQFDAACGRSAWAPMFGQPDKQWYPRITLQAGGSEGGPIPTSLTTWRFWVHEYASYVPA